jgi:hypothetical protein
MGYGHVVRTLEVNCKCVLETDYISVDTKEPCQ